MPIDPRKLRPTECVRLLNSLGEGEVLSASKLKRHRDRAGLQIGDGTTIDLIKYCAWLIVQRRAAETAADRYGKTKADAAERSKTQSAAGRDIGPIPEIANPERRQRAEADLGWGLKTYFPDTFFLDWSADHLRIIGRMETIVKTGGLIAIAMPRGSGKSTISECVAILAACFGWRSFIVLIGSEKEAAVEMLDSIKMRIEENDLLAEDFPEVVYPIRKLEGISNRCAGQHQGGKRTHITWTDTEIVLPTIDGSRASGAIIRVAGIRGRIRGMKSTLADGTTVRPDLVIPDDPQTDESAKSPDQCDHRERVLCGAVLGLAGPGRKISAFMPCTIIRPGDLSARILDRNKNPEWNGETTRMVYEWPSERGQELWKKYRKVRNDGLRKGDDGRAGNRFYAKNRAIMDEGAVVGWESRKEDCLSALQHAYNLRFRNEETFFAEYQNEPLVDEGAIRQLTTDEVLARLNGFPRGIVPKTAAILTGYIDVQLSMLYWLVVAWRDDFKGDIVAYGSFPDQNRPWYTVRDSENTLAKKYGGGEEANIISGLLDLSGILFEREWKRDDGTVATLDRMLIDADYQQDLVYQVCRKSPHKNILSPAKSRYVGPENRPFSEFTNHPGDRAGLNWRSPAPGRKHAIRRIDYDVNFWKSFALSRLLNPIASPGALEIYGEDPAVHKFFAHHLTAEYYDMQTSERTGRTMAKWLTRPGYENHWWDCLVGSCVAASIQGASLPELEEEQGPKKPKISLSELQKQKRGR